MRITPLEIRQKSFERKLRGYDKEEVDAFLTGVSQQWEKHLEENRDQKMRLEILEREVQKLREVESSLYKTLKTAEDTGNSLVEQAHKTAELIIREAQMKAEVLHNDSRNDARNKMEDADDKVKSMLFNAQNHLNELITQIRQVENHKENLILEVNNLLSETQEKINRVANKNKKFEINIHTVNETNISYQSVSQLSSYSQENTGFLKQESTLKPSSTIINLQVPEKTVQQKLSFFDELN